MTDSSVPAGGTNSVAVSEINPAGNSLLFSTLFGGNGQESQFTNGGLALGPTGNIFVAADTSSTNLPVTAGAFQSTLTGNQVDGFLAIFQPGASPGLSYCTYLGIGANQEMGVGGLAVDAAGNAFLAGYTSSFVGAAFPAKNAFQAANAGGPFDAFLMKVSPLGQGASDLAYATLLGGSGLDKAFAVAVDTQNPPDAYVTGTTQSPDFPVSTASGGATAALPNKFARKRHVQRISQRRRAKCIHRDDFARLFDLSRWIGLRFRPEHSCGLGAKSGCGFERGICGGRGRFVEFSLA